MRSRIYTASRSLCQVGSTDLLLIWSRRSYNENNCWSNDIRYAAAAASALLVSSADVLRQKPLLCESAPVGTAVKPLNLKPESYAQMVLKQKRPKNVEEVEEDEDDIYGKLDDADLLWALRPEQKSRMGVVQINANEQLEDRAVLQEIHTLNNGPLLLAGVMDGHGGWQVAEYVHRKIGAYIERQINKTSAARPNSAPLTDEELAEAMKIAFNLLDRDVMKKMKGTCDIGLSRNARVGACCVVALVTDSSIIVANSGDCRAVLDDGGVVRSLSYPHSANEAEERARLKAEHPGEHDIGRLQPTRSFGDFYLKLKEFAYDHELDRPFIRNGDSFPYITAEPETKIFSRTKGKKQFLLLASDGVWDFLTPQEAVDIARPTVQESVEVAGTSVIQNVLRKASTDSGVSLTQIAIMPPKQKRRIFDDTIVCIVKLD